MSSAASLLSQPLEPYRIARKSEIPIEREQSAVQAVLSVHGDLRLMAVGWTAEEFKARRRLVQFWRHVEGPFINVHFCPIKPEEYDDSQTVVSCIYRKDVDRCYITSFDLIKLFEGILGSVYSREEKDRIRRNVDHVENETVSRSKPYLEEFFNLIMCFPAPKPRSNIRDLKAFGWDSLEEALRAVVDKMALDYDPTPASEMVELPIPDIPEPEPEPDRFVAYIPPIQIDVSDYQTKTEYSDSIYDFRLPGSSTSAYEPFNGPNHRISSLPYHHLQPQGHLPPNGGAPSFRFMHGVAASLSNFNTGPMHSPNASTLGSATTYQPPWQSTVPYSYLCHEDPCRFGGMFCGISTASASSLDGALGSSPAMGGGRYGSNRLWVGPSQ